MCTLDVTITIVPQGSGHINQTREDEGVSWVNI